MKLNTPPVTTISLSTTDHLDDRLAQPVNIRAFLPGYPELPEADLREDVFIIPNRIPLTPTRRLIVIVPRGDIDDNALARRTWRLAASSGLSVLYLALESEVLHYSHQCRRLSGLAFMTSTREVRATAKVCDEENWEEALRSILRPGDLFVCLANHRLPGYFIPRKVLGHWLAESMGKPVYMLGGIQIGSTWQQRQRIKDIRAWIASLALMAVFFVFQVKVDHSISGPASTLLLCISILVEIYSLFKINEWIG